MTSTRIGAHVRTGGRLPNAIANAQACGAEAIAVFVSNPRAWARPRLTSDVAAEFRAAREAAEVGPVYAHATYLVNLATANDEVRERSIEMALLELGAVHAIGADGLVVHAGSGGRQPRTEALTRAASGILEIAEQAGGLTIELTAGAPGAVAANLAEAEELFEAIGWHERVGLCLDTCHLFVAGAPLDTPEGVEATFAELRDRGLAERLRLVHANDAKGERGSRLDRHEAIGEGRIGLEGFRAVLAQPEVTAAVVETETEGHARDIARLRSLL